MKPLPQEISDLFGDLKKPPSWKDRETNSRNNEPDSSGNEQSNNPKNSHSGPAKPRSRFDPCEWPNVRIKR